MYKLNLNSASITRILDNAGIPNDPANSQYAEYLQWIAAGNTPTPADVPPIKTVLELDVEKYLRRAGAKDLLMAKMAAMNVGRLKTGAWTTPQLVNLMADPDIKSLVSHMETLSFELAISVVNGLTNPLITPAIKSTWVAELTAAL